MQKLDKTIIDKIRLTIQHKRKQDMTMTSRDKTGQVKTRRGKTGEGKSSQDKTRQDKTRQNKNMRKIGERGR